MWQKFFHKKLTKKDKITDSLIQPLETKIDRIEKNISKLFENKTTTNENKITFDLESLTRETNLENLLQLQQQIENLLFEVTNYSYWDMEDGNQHSGKRITFDKRFDTKLAKQWLEYLKPLTQSFKLSLKISVENVFKGFPLIKYNKYNSEIGYKTIFELFTVYNSLENEDKNNLVNTVCQQLNNNYEKPIIKVQPIVDDLPF